MVHTHKKKALRARGFTLIEILVVIGMLAILSTIVLVAVNPLRQFAQARNTQRQNDVTAILNAISERIADNGGIFNPNYANPTDGCTVTAMGTAPQIIAKTDFDLRPCLVPAYISEIPHDPTSGSNTCTTSDCSGENESYNSGYSVKQDPTSKRITICSDGAAEGAIPGSKQFCLTR